MGVILFPFTAITLPVSVSAGAQQLSDAGLGDWWQESSGGFVTKAAQTFTQRSYPLTATATAGDACVTHFGSTPGAALTYTGKLIIGYFDTGNSDKLLQSVVKYYQGGEDVSLTIAEDRVNTPVPHAFTFVLSRRSDGVVVANQDITVSDADVIDFAFDISPLLKGQPGVVVSTISGIVVSPSGAMVATKVGPRDATAVLHIDGGQVAGTDYDVTCNVLTSAGQTIQANGKFLTVATP